MRRAIRSVTIWSGVTEKSSHQGRRTHMKMYLISDNVDTYTGMRLAGVDGVVERR